MSYLILSCADILPLGDAFHLTRAVLAGTRPKALHGHDFYELLWVQNGIVRHHLANGDSDLREGDVVFVAPGHTHALQGRGDDALIVSISLHPDVVTGIGVRHHSLVGHMFWAATANPVVRHRDMRQLADLNHAALRLERSARTALEAEAFILSLCATLLDETVILPPAAPVWLAQACAAAFDPKVFRDGAAGFVRVTGKAHAHVSRVAKLHLGKSPSQYVNGIRMDWAARRLAGTGDTLAEIATDCGLPNLSHFHSLFNDRHGLTPHRYRKRMQHEVVQPDL